MFGNVTEEAVTVMQLKQFALRLLWLMLPLVDTELTYLYLATQPSTRTIACCILVFKYSHPHIGLDGNFQPNMVEYIHVPTSIS